MWTQSRRLYLGLHCLLKWLQTTLADDLCCICALRVNKCNGKGYDKGCGDLGGEAGVGVLVEVAAF